MPDGVAAEAIKAAKDHNELVRSIGTAGRLAIRVIEWGVGLVGYIAYLRMRAELPVEEEKTDPPGEKTA